MLKFIRSFSPPRILIMSVFLAIAAGTVLLSFPFAQAKPIAFIDAFFTATSAICGCGLTTIPLNSFSPFGYIILLILMQIGGLSLVTIMLFIFSLFVQFGLRAQLLGGQFFELESWKNFKSVLAFTIAFSALVELIGAVLIFCALAPLYPFKKALFLSLFHSVSLFCQAGFSLFPNGMVQFADNYFLLMVGSILMLFGGLGFFVWYDLFLYVKSLVHIRKHHISLHSKIVMIMTSILVVSVCLLYWIFEHCNTLASMSTTGAIFNTIFNGIASRGTGIYTIPLINLQLATIFIIMIYALIGSSPGSTGSGIKITTFALICSIIKAAVLGKHKVTLQNRTIPEDQTLRAVAIFSLSIAIISCITLCLLITEKGHSFFSIFFEVTSSFASLGLTTGITSLLTTTGKFFIMFSMVAGRLGPLGIILAVQQKRPEAIELAYPEERIMLG